MKTLIMTFLIAALQSTNSYALSYGDQVCGVITEIDDERVTMLTRFETSRSSRTALYRFETTSYTKDLELLEENACACVNIRDAYAKSIVDFRHDDKYCDSIKSQAESLNLLQ